MTRHDRPLNVDEAEVLKWGYPCKAETKRWLKKRIARWSRRTWRQRYEKEEWR